MRRLVVLSMLMAAGSLSLVAAYQQPAPPTSRTIEVEKLKDNFYVLRGGGGNTAVLVTPKGVVVVDTKNPGWGQPILDKIKELTDKPVTTIINTHTHGDHVSGNVEFATPVEIVVQENTRTNMGTMTAPSGMAANTAPQTIFQANNGKGMPTRTFKDKMTLNVGGQRIDLRYFGRGHTNGDAWVVFPALRIMHAGDDFPGKNVPILDANNGGSGIEMPKTLTKAADFAKNIDTIVTGHSTNMAVADLREYAAFNQDFLNAVQEGKKAGKSVDEIAAAWTVPPKYAGYAAPQATRVKSNVDVVYKELK